MGLLLYKSNEMFSSTELIRKSKMIFDKILGRKIEKAIILRDGKPSFLLMEFSKYEKIMAEYEELKEYVESLEDTGTKKEKRKKKKEESLKKELQEESDLLSIQKDDYSTNKIERIQKETPKKVELPLEETTKPQTIQTETEKVVSKAIEKEIEPMVKEITEEEEIQKAYASIEAMSFDPSMKEQAKENIRLKIVKAREERAKVADAQEQNLQEINELEEQIQQEKLKKEQELEEFWD
jgi:hypothetical protein